MQSTTDTRVRLCLLLAFFIAPASAAVSLIITPGEQSLERSVGSNVTLACRLGSGEPKANIGLQWTKHMGTLEHEGHVEVKQLDSNNAILYLTNATTKDSGVYTCKATVDGETAAESSVDVVFFNKLRFIDSNNHLGSLTPASNVNISCRVYLTDGDVVTTTWYKNNFVLIPNAEKYNLHESGSILEIKSYNSATDPAEYKCAVSNYASGTSITRSSILGSLNEARTIACTNQCQAFCQNLVAYGP